MQLKCFAAGLMAGGMMGMIGAYFAIPLLKPQMNRLVKKGKRVICKICR